MFTRGQAKRNASVSGTDDECLESLDLEIGDVCRPDVNTYEVCDRHTTDESTTDEETLLEKTLISDKQSRRSPLPSKAPTDGTSCKSWRPAPSTRPTKSSATGPVRN